MYFLSGLHFAKLKSDNKISGFVYYNEIENNLPWLAYLLTFFAVIDATARVMRKVTEFKRNNRKLFIYSSKRWFKLTNKQAELLWEVRNGISHHYHLIPKINLTTSNNENPVKFRAKYKDWVIYVKELYPCAEKGKLEAYKYVRSLSESKQKKYDEYLNTNGFIYTQSPLKEFLAK